MDTLCNKIAYLALSIILLAAIWKTVKAYLSDDSVKKQIKNFIFVCIFLGAAPGLVNVSSHLGESIIKPVKAITDYVSSSISTELTSSISKGQ